MSRQSRNTGGSAANAGTRMNEYFVPRDGIDREVISADICRYLGNDALVRPGHYENPQSRQTVQGYYITAYRNLTTAMIEDLKADSARWDSERRSQSSRNTPGGTHTLTRSSGPAGVCSSNPTITGQYRYSETHQSRQHHGPTESPYQQDSYRDTSFEQARYPGTNAPGYGGASGSSYSHSSGYAAQSNNNYSGYQQPQTQQLSGHDSRFATGSGQPNSMMGHTFQTQESPFVNAGANMSQRGYAPSDNYGASRAASSNVPIPQPTYATSQSQQGHLTSSAGSYSQFSGQPSQGSSQQYAGIQPQDPFFGRASPAGQPPPGYTSQGQQYEEPHTSRSTASPLATQVASASSKARRSDRDSDRHTSDRHSRTASRR